MSSPTPTADPQFPSHWLGLAQTICDRYYAEFPDHDERYGDRGRGYCAHDNAYLVAWLVDALGTAGHGSFATNVEWLRGLLEARGFPLDAFRRNLQLVGEAVAALRPEDARRIDELIAGANRTKP
jgi:hypothetical protein